MHVCLYINQERQKESCCGIVSFFVCFLFFIFFIIFLLLLLSGGILKTQDLGEGEVS